jgi:LacI family transcriptional regulator
VNSWRRHSFSAVFAATDMIAAGAVQALREGRVRVPDEVSVGYDNIPVAIDAHPALTTVSVPHEEQGRTAVRLALHRDNSPEGRRQILGTHIAVRDSTRRSGRRLPRVDERVVETDL